LAVVALVTAAGGAARADGTLAMRGVYYKEKSTRVIQPMVDGMFEVGTRGLVDAHLLVDAITSASPGSGAVNAVPFTERRYEVGGGYAHELDGPPESLLDKLRLRGDTKFSTESDYRSIYGGARIEADVAQKNATVATGGGVSRDSMDAAGAQGALGGIMLRCPGDTSASSKGCHLTTFSGFASVSQIVSRNAIVSATYDLAYLDGYQSNPYRSVVTPGGFVQEQHPFKRLRQAIAVSARLYLPKTETTLIGAYRFYHDDWKINAHTPELRIVQQVGATADASVRFRYYTQSAAFFWRARYPDPTVMPLPYYTDDPKMSAFDGQLLEAKLGVLGRTFGLGGTWARTRFEGILEYVLQSNRFGNAGVAHVAVTVPFDY
jgi:hypothetical protein